MDMQNMVKQILSVRTPLELAQRKFEDAQRNWKEVTSPYRDRSADAHELARAQAYLNEAREELSRLEEE